AIITAGGIGAAKNLYVGGNEIVTGTITSNNTTDSSSTSTGGIIGAGGLGVAKTAYFGTGIYLPSTGAIVLLLSHYSTTTITYSLGGAVSTGTFTVRLKRNGRVVYVSFDSITFTATS